MEIDFDAFQFALEISIFSAVSGLCFGFFVSLIVYAVTKAVDLFGSVSNS